MAGSEFLDKQGLMVLWDRIKELVYECCCGHKDYECINDEVITTECFEKAVLSVTGGKGGDCGFSCDTRITTLYEGSIVVSDSNSGGSGQATRSGQDTPPIYKFLSARIPYGGKPVDTMRITLNGVTYICEMMNRAGEIGYSDSLTEPTFAVAYVQGKAGYEWRLLVMSAGTYALKLENYYEKIETTECFDKAVQSVIGYSCTDTNQPIYSGSIETLDGDPAFSDPISLDELSSIPPRLWVNFNSPTPNFIEVEGRSIGIGNEYEYGASFDKTTGTWDFSTYPFAIVLKMLELGGVDMMLVTEEADSYLLDLGVEMPTATVNECFKAAVNEAVDVSPSLGYIPVYYDNDNDSFYSDMSFADMNKMFQNGTLYAIKLGSASGLGANYSVFPLVSGTSYIPTKASAQNSLLIFQHTEVYHSESGVETEEFVIDLDDETITYNIYKYPHTIGDGE